ncbi:MAG: hypothetical protein CM15mP127_03160 [Gammaproteobacteria bacterium]|nr:MAG: hypothetical protein CM15mP127_03160 [Gammaproteobacteria bacterium]
MNFCKMKFCQGLDISVDEFWKLTSEIITEFSDRNKPLGKTQGYSKIN